MLVAFLLLFAQRAATAQLLDGHGRLEMAGERQIYENILLRGGSEATSHLLYRFIYVVYTCDFR